MPNRPYLLRFDATFASLEVIGKEGVARSNIKESTIKSGLLRRLGISKVDRGPLHLGFILCPTLTIPAREVVGSRESGIDNTAS